MEPIAGLHLEVTEGTLIDDVEEAVENIRAANELGINC